MAFFSIAWASKILPGKVCYTYPADSLEKKTKMDPCICEIWNSFTVNFEYEALFEVKKKQYYQKYNILSPVNSVWHSESESTLAPCVHESSKFLLPPLRFSQVAHSRKDNWYFYLNSTVKHTYLWYKKVHFVWRLSFVHDLPIKWPKTLSLWYMHVGQKSCPT